MDPALPHHETSPKEGSLERGLASLVLEAFTDGVSVSDENGFIIYTNPAEDRMFGYGPGELVGQHVSVLNSYSPEENTGQVQDVIAHLNSEGLWQGQWCNRRRDGSTFYSHARITSTDWQGRSCWIRVQQEVSGPRLMEEQFQTLADSIANLAWMAHADGYIFWYNRRWYEYTGTTPEQMQGWGWQSVHDPVELPRVTEEWRKSIASATPFEMVFPLRGADGRFRQFLTHSVPMFDSAGSVDRWFGTNTDISAQVEAETALRNIEERLLGVVEASGKLLETLSVSQALLDTVEIAPRLVPCDAVAVWRADEQDRWSIVASQGLSDSYLRDCHDVQGPALQDRLPFSIGDVFATPGTDARRAMYRKEGIHAMLGVPLRIQGGLHGTLIFYFRNAREFSEGEKEVARALGNVAASALTSAEMYERQTETRSRAEAGERRAAFLARAGAMLVSSLQPETALDGLMELAVPEVADYAWTELRDPAGRPAVVSARHSEGDGATELIRAVASGEALPEAWSTGVQASASIGTGDRAAGRIVFGLRRPGRAVEEAEYRRLVEEIAQRASVAVENARLHQEVREAEERARIAMEAAELGTWDFDNVSQRLTWSARCKAFFGLPPDSSLPGEQVIERVHPEDRAYVAAMARRVMDPASDGSSHAEFRTLLPDGSVRWLVSLGRVFFEGEGAGRRAVRMIGIMRDSTAARLAEQERQALLGREQEARSAAELLNRVGPILLSELDRDRLVQKLVDLCTRLVGASTGALAADVDIRDAIRLADYQKTAALPANLPLFGTGICSVLAVPVRAPSGESFGTLVFGHPSPDVFDLREEQLAEGIAAQAAVALDNARLFEEALRVQNELEKTNRSLRAANMDLEQFAFAAAHDLREPLRMVTTYTQLLERRMGQQLSDEQRVFMLRIVEGARRMVDLLQDLLSYTNTATQSEPAGPVELDGVIGTVLQNLSSWIADSGAEVVIVSPLPVISGRPGHMVLIFQNLIGNGIKYRRPDVTPRVEISAEASDGRWLFRVKDNGIGIEPRYHAQIFGVFKRLHGRDIPGTGIGLAICQRAVERAGESGWNRRQAAGRHSVSRYRTGL